MKAIKKDSWVELDEVEISAAKGGLSEPTDGEWELIEVLRRQCKKAASPHCIVR